MALTCLRMTFGTSAGRRGMADAQLASVACSRASAAGIAGRHPCPLSLIKQTRNVGLLEQDWSCTFLPYLVQLTCDSAKLFLCAWLQSRNRALRMDDVSCCGADSLLCAGFKLYSRTRVRQGLMPHEQDYSQRTRLMAPVRKPS